MENSWIITFLLFWDDWVRLRPCLVYPQLLRDGDRDRHKEKQRDRDRRNRARGEPIARSSLGRDLLSLRVTFISTAWYSQAKEIFIQTGQTESWFGLLRRYPVTARQGNMISPLKTVSVRSTVGLPGWNWEKIRGVEESLSNPVTNTHAGERALYRLGNQYYKAMIDFPGNGIKWKKLHLTGSLTLSQETLNSCPPSLFR